ncbi:MAG: TetR/AcrR family transcriptional regulator [Spirochaetales bacterium]|jgi:AcrR family transcriptional regulator|nr:TetR/AcrR family transcriptional regulator [Spirochaetales bacterium]
MARKLDEEKRTRILEAARGAFGDGGFQKTTIKNIAEKTGLAQGTVYTYFENKENLFDAVVEDIWREFDNGMKKINFSSASLIKKFTEFLDFGFALLEQVHPLLRGMYSEANRRELLSEKLDTICSYIDRLFISSQSNSSLFGPLSAESRKFNLNIMVSGVLFRASLTKPEDLDQELIFMKNGILRAMGDRIAMGQLK